MNPWIALPLTGGLGLCGLFVALWLWQQKHRDAGIVDVGWALGLGALAVYYGLAGDGLPARRWLVALLGGLWGGRLALHLFFDRILGKPEDGRYQTLRAGWGQNAPAAFFVFFQAQALLDILLSLPFLLAARNPAPRLAPFEVGGALLWLIALLGEATADRQLAAWRADPAHRGRTCRAGLWRYSRHPNYFCEWLIWCAYALIALPAPHGWLALTAPALILVFLFRVTGIPTTEAQALRSRGDDYRRYQRETSVFVPWFPRRERA
jgi:steroid 5-alpha reductase family enzyme